MKKWFLYSGLLAIVLVMALTSCEKPSFEDDGISPITNPVVTNPTTNDTIVKIGYTYETGSNLKSAFSGTLTNGQTFTFTEKGWQTLFWLLPDTTVKGSWSISLNGALKMSKGLANTISYNFPDTGSYTMNVTGTHGGSPFSISVIAKITTAATPTVTNGPIRWVSTTASGTNWNIYLRCAKSAISATGIFNSYSWTGDAPLFTSWSTHAALSLVNDSVDLTISLPNTFNANFGFAYIGENGTASGVWASPSGDFYDATRVGVFQFKFNGSNGVITLASGKTINPGGTTSTTVPGLEGAGDFRLTPNVANSTIDVYYKYTGIETVYYRYCNDSISWTTVAVAAKYTGNNQWVTASIPMVNVGAKKLYLQFGSASGTSFAPFTIDSPGYWDRKWLKLQY
jgi:hypothetical protein